MTATMKMKTKNNDNNKYGLVTLIFEQRVQVMALFGFYLP